MDISVALVRAYLQLNGYFTVTAVLRNSPETAAAAYTRSRNR